MIKASMQKTVGELEVHGEQAEIEAEMMLLIVTMKSWISDKISEDEAENWWTKTVKLIEVAESWEKVTVEEMD